MLYLIIIYLTVACTQIRTKKVRTKAFTVNNTFGLLAPSFQKFIKRWCNGRQRSVYLASSFIVFFFNLTQVVTIWYVDTCWMYIIRLIINMSAFTFYSLVVFQKKTSGRRSSILTPLHPGKQFKPGLVKSKCSCGSVIHDAYKCVDDAYVCVFSRIGSDTQAGKNVRYNWIYFPCLPSWLLPFPTESRQSVTSAKYMEKS